MVEQKVEEIPDQQEDPEGYVKAVQAELENEAERAEEEDRIARERSGRPTREQEEADAEKIRKGAEDQAKRDKAEQEKAEKEQAKA
jgi:hypothetical protein